jgi:pyruvate dehydrogenase E2 component (dihydrolipoamide acetyltransferase)
MANNWATIPAVTYDIKVDMTEVLNLKNKLKAVRKVTITDLLVKISAKTLMEHPLLNASLDGNDIITRNFVNIGIAVAIEDGLMVPVVKYANVLGLEEISDEIKSLAKQAKNNTIALESLQGGTFTITNLGMFGMNAFSPIINAPEVAILGVNTIEDVLAMVDGQVVSKPMMTLSLSADHRVVDGAVAANFLKSLKNYIEHPEMLLL